MVMRRVIAKALEELAAASEEQSRPRPRPTELYHLSDYLTDAKPRPLPPPEVEAQDEERPVRPRASSTIPAMRRRRHSRRPEIVRALSSSAGVQQALILQEILGPPKALRPWDEDPL
jgi:hypothetical protein